MQDMTEPLISVHENIISIKVPLNLKRKGGRKLIMSPASHLNTIPVRKPDETMVRALARAWKWQRMLDEGKYKSLDDLAQQNKINASYVSRILRLTLLAPNIKQAIMDGMQPRGMSLQDMQQPFPDLWEEQREWFGF